WSEAGRGAGTARARVAVDDDAVHPPLAERSEGGGRVARRGAAEAAQGRRGRGGGSRVNLSRCAGSKVPTWSSGTPMSSSVEQIGPSMSELVPDRPLRRPNGVAV